MILQPEIFKEILCVLELLSPSMPRVLDCLDRRVVRDTDIKGQSIVQYYLSVIELERCRHGKAKVVEDRLCLLLDVRPDSSPGRRCFD